jgi:hypothetical protein
MTEPKPTYGVQSPPSSGAVSRDTLTCRRCGATLATVTEYDRKTALILSTREGLPVLAFRARIVCACGAAQMYFSMPAAGRRLGIEE